MVIRKLERDFPKKLEQYRVLFSTSIEGKF